MKQLWKIIEWLGQGQPGEDPLVWELEARLARAGFDPSSPEARVGIATVMAQAAPMWRR